MTPLAVPPVRRLVLVPAAQGQERGDAMVRRYRLARLRLEGREAARAERSGSSRRSDA